MEEKGESWVGGEEVLGARKGGIRRNGKEDGNKKKKFNVKNKNKNRYGIWLIGDVTGGKGGGLAMKYTQR